jgi:hypothetical protein
MTDDKLCDEWPYSCSCEKTPSTSEPGSCKCWPDCEHYVEYTKNASTKPVQSTSPQEIRDHLKTVKDRVRGIINAYKAEYSNLWEDYTLVAFLYFREYHVWYDRMPEPVVKPLEQLIIQAANKSLPSMETVCRALRIVKKEFQTPEDRERSREKEEAYRKALIPEEDYPF